MGHADAPAPPLSLQVEVVYCPQPGDCDVVPLRLESGATVADAVAASGLLQRHALTGEAANPPLTVGIWGRVQRDLATPLRDGDRIELYRPLQVDPKEARRARYREHLARLAAKPPRKLRSAAKG